MPSIASEKVLKPPGLKKLTQPPSRGEKAHTFHLRRAFIRLRRRLRRNLIISAKKQATEPSFVLIVSLSIISNIIVIPIMLLTFFGLRYLGLGT